jgi:ribokinase
VGEDAFGVALRAGLIAGGVDDRFVRTLPDAGSGMSVAIQDASGDYAATIVSGANLLILPAWADEPALWQDVGLLVLQNEVPGAVNLAAARAARARGLVTLWNAAPARAPDAGLAQLVDVLIVNAVEAEMMGAGPVGDLESAARAARALRQAAPATAVIVTAGARGLAAETADGTAFRIPAQKVTVVSSHGAGDAFIGALAAGLLSGESLPVACARASDAAARHVAGKGGSPA